MDDNAVTKIEDVELAVGRVEKATKQVHDAVKQVELAIKNKSSSVGIVFMIAILIWACDALTDLWYSRWRYAATYGISESSVQITSKPHDCNFLAAPIGEKYCHYDRIVSFVRWGENENGYPRISYDDGKTWEAYTKTDPNEQVPRGNFVKMIAVGWDKKDGD